MSVKAKKGVADIPIFIPAKSIEAVREELGKKEIIKLSANENRLGYSPKIPEALKKEAGKLNIYPDVGCPVLREAVAGHHGIRDDRILFGNGLFEVILLIAQAYVDSGDEVLVPETTFGWYATASLHEDAVVKKIPLKNFEIDLNAITDAITDRTKIVWLCNPNNPTGRLIPETDLEDFLRKVPEDVLVVIDEAYIDFAPENYRDAVHFIEQYDNLVVLRTFSKLYGLAALRIGYALANEDIIENLTKVKQPLNVNANSQIAAKVSLEDREFKQKVQENNRKGLQMYYDTFKKWKLQYIESFANFLLVNIETDSGRVEQELMQEGILLRNGKRFNYDGWLRITVGTYEDNVTVIKALGRILGKK